MSICENSREKQSILNEGWIGTPPPCKSTRKHKPGNNANAHGSALPPEAFHIHAPVGFELDAFPFQQVLLFGPIGGGAAGVVDYAVAGVAAVQLGMAEDVAYQPRIVVAADQAGNLTVAGHLAAGYLPYGGQNLVNQVLVQYFAQGGIPFLISKHRIPASGGSVNAPVCTWR